METPPSAPLLASPALSRFAGFWIRGVALSIDHLLLLPFLLLSFVLEFYFPSRGGWMLATWVGPVAVIVYEVGFNVGWGATPGKMLCGLRVVQAPATSTTNDAVEEPKVPPSRPHALPLRTALRRVAVSGALMGINAAITTWQLRAVSNLTLQQLIESLRSFDAYGAAGIFRDLPGTPAGLSFIMCVWYLAEFFAVVLDPTQRALHDRIAQTHVVHSPR